MKSILSIDFDYFIDASSKERDIYFPQGADEIPQDKLMSFWDEKYKKYPELKKLGVIREFYILKDFLTTLNISKKNFVKADNHKYIKRLIDTIPMSLQLRIINIDFHHDYYHYYKGEDNCNCGNWLRRLMEERPDTKVKWIRRRNSQTVCLDGEFPFEHTDDIKSIYNESFDYVFVCRSPEWSPPHLIDKYEELISLWEGRELICGQ
ncbi:MAG: hypothetical protein GX757_08110 [Clostridiales bacterium]|nr:hypothetical protein [Clostridiales bacterium]